MFSKKIQFNFATCFFIIYYFCLHIYYLCSAFCKQCVHCSAYISGVRFTLTGKKLGLDCVPNVYVRKSILGPDAALSCVFLIQISRGKNKSNKIIILATNRFYVICFIMIHFFSKQYSSLSTLADSGNFLTMDVMDRDD